MWKYNGIFLASTIDYDNSDYNWKLQKYNGQFDNDDMVYYIQSISNGKVLSVIDNEISEDMISETGKLIKRNVARQQE